MASARFMKRVVDKGKELCRSVDGKPKEYYYPGFKPSKYCMVPSEEKTKVYYEDFTWCGPSPACCVVTLLAFPEVSNTRRASVGASARSQRAGVIR